MRHQTVNILDILKTFGKKLNFLNILKLAKFENLEKLENFSICKSMCK